MSLMLNIQLSMIVNNEKSLQKKNKNKNNQKELKYKKNKN
jgi:hypothetical protein